jgi:outer membrane protein assembly factor BamB
MSVPLDQWNQFGGNPAGSGFRAVNSTAATQASWRVEIPGGIGTTSPVVGPDGTIYLGNLAGQLFAIGPDGSTQWTTTVAGTTTAVRTPAIGADGNIYCVCTLPPPARDHRTPRPFPDPTNFIVGVKHDGTVFARSPVPVRIGENTYVNGVIDGAPRIVTSGSSACIVFVVRCTYQVPYPELGPGAMGPLTASYLYAGEAYDQGSGLGFPKLAHLYDEQRLFVDAHGSGGFGGGAHLGDPPDLPGPKLPETARPCAHMPLVFGSYSTRDPWTIVVPTDAGLHQLEWNRESNTVTESGNLAMPGTFPGPAAFPNRLIANVARATAVLVDTDTFTRYNPEATSLSRDATVAGGLRQMYFVVRQGTLMAVDANGSVWKHRQLGADSVAYPALTGNHVHVATASGLRTLTLMLEEVSAVDLPGAGYSSPAVDANGSVFVATNDALFGFLNDGSSPLRGRHAPDVRDFG